MREGQYLRLRCNVSVDSVPEASTEWSGGVDLEGNMAARFYQAVDGKMFLCRTCFGICIMYSL